MKTATAAIAVLAVLALCIVPMQGVYGDFADITGEKNVIGVGDDADYQIIYTNHDYDDAKTYPNLSMAIEYDAKLVDEDGDTVSNGVSPSSGDLDNGTAETLTVSAPDDAGRYTLVVVYTVEVSYTVTDEEGNSTTETKDLEKTERFPISVVEPVTLSVTLSNSSGEPLRGYGVYFYVDGQMMEDSYTVINLEGDGTTTISYEWITDAGNGAHEFRVEAADGGNMVDIVGLGESHTFYLGDNDYTWIIVLLVVVIVLLVLVMVWVYRKPVKNYGKPKSRR